MDPHFTTRRPLAAVAAVSVDPVEIKFGLTDFARLAVRIAAYAAGMVAGLFESRRPAGLTAPALSMRRAGSRITPRPIKPPPPEALPLLTEAIVGSSKFTIASVLGIPRSAVAEGLAAVEAHAGEAFFQTDTWYYPLPRHGQIAMAVSFVGDVARNVEFFHAPGVSRLTRRQSV